MNKRIKELIAECTDYVYGEGGSYEMFDKEWFAVLVARDCIGICNSIEKIAGLAWECSDAIKEHFDLEL